MSKWDRVHRIGQPRRASLPVQILSWSTTLALAVLVGVFAGGYYLHYRAFFDFNSTYYRRDYYEQRVEEDTAAAFWIRAGIGGAATGGTVLSVMIGAERFYRRKRNGDR